MDNEFLARAPRLRVLARTGVGVERVDLDAATARGIAVVITPGSGTNAVAEGAIAMALHLVKRFGPLTTLVRTGQWATRNTYSVGDLAGSVLGVVGYGRIGQRAAALGAALGMTVLAYDPVSEPPADVRCADLHGSGQPQRRDHPAPAAAGVHPSPGRAELLGHVKPGAVLVNCGRGGLIDIDAVYAALQDGRLGGVGLDVFDPEPPGHHPLFDHPDVVLTPHLMGMSRQGSAATYIDAAQGVLDVLTGTPTGRGRQPRLGKGGEPDDRSVGIDMKDLLTGKVVLISGGTQGLGAGDRARRRPGGRHRGDLRTQRRARRRRSSPNCRTPVPTASFVRTDISDVTQAQASVAATIERHGRIDCLVNAAGLTTRGSMLDTTPELFDQHIAVNLRAPFFLMQAAIADMKRRGEPGTIVNVISIDSHGGQSFLAPYVAAKAGLAGLTKNAAHAHRWDRIRINGLNMGWSATDGENQPRQRAGARRQGAGTGSSRPGRRCRWASSASSTRSPTSSSSCCPTAAASSPGRSSTGTRTSSAASGMTRIRRTISQSSLRTHSSRRRAPCVSA